MIELRPKTLRIVWLLVAAMLFGGASLVHSPLDKLSRQYELVPAGDATLARHPELALLRVAPGGLRALVINYFWMRSQNLHRQGRHFDAMQLAELICTLQPRFPGVWQFQAWQLAWNISATADTPNERWHWVRSGIELLRDRGIAMNPNALLLYKQLSWTFASKMGDNTDEMHWYYKKVWARDMQNLLGAPAAIDEKGILAAFKPIADAPVDKDPYRPRGSDIQSDQRRKLLRDNPDVAALAEELRAVGLAMDASLLRAYNYCTKDDAVDITRLESIEDRDRRLEMTTDAIKDSDEKRRREAEIRRRAEWATIINNPARTEALGKALAFVRAQILWGVHKMDPEYMYDMMKRYGPIDWRLVWSHGLYWSVYGVEHCTDVPDEHIDVLNTDRTLLTCLKTLTWQGKMDYFAPQVQLSGSEPTPDLRLRSDWRFIEAAHQEYIKLGKVWSQRKNERFRDNPLDDGHVNFLANAIAALYVRGRKQQAQKYFNWVRDNYERKEGEEWGAETLDQFVLASLKSRQDLIPRVATAQLTASLQMAMIWLAGGDDSAFESNVKYARALHDKYHRPQGKRTQRLALPPLDALAAGILVELLVRPKWRDADLSLEQRSVMYTAMKQRWPRSAAIAYDMIRRPLMRQCRAENLDFNRLFPPPGGLDEVRRQRAAQSRQN